MRGVSLTAILVLGAACAAYALGPSEREEFKQDLTGALMDLGMTQYDLTVRSDYAEPDVFRLPMIDSLMADPAALLETADDLAGGLESESLAAELVYMLWDAMSVEPEVPRGDVTGRPRMHDIAGRASHFPPELARAINLYTARLAGCSSLLERATANVKMHMDFLYANYPFLVTPSRTYEEVGPFELHDLEKTDEALVDSVLSVSEAIDIPSLAGMTYLAAQAAEDLLVDLEAAQPIPPALQRYGTTSVTFAGVTSRVEGKITYLGVSDHGPVVIGGSSANAYHGCFALIVDPGGDDVYELVNDKGVGFRLVVDLSGNDTYRSADTAAIAGAVLGTSILMDMAGDDIYSSPGIALGAAICGAGLLLDREGNDYYDAGAFSEGAGFLGVGILKDARGHDTYVAGMQSQGFGYVMGSGLLLEGGGNDTYYTRMAHTDILRYDDHYLTLSQGCAFGSRPDYSGGIGMLVDEAGNDLYSSDIFGQGVGYWFAMGALIDRGGHDRYCSYQYAQGSGVHLAFGLLLDESGDDFYQSKGVSQGCGHDLSLGLLADFSGNDCYTATDLSQAAGNANGTGILYDRDGSDSYSSKNRTNVNGYGDYRREFGSIGIHLDCRGRDFYAARGKDDWVWESGKYGIGLDRPEEARKPLGDLVIKEYPLEERDFTPEDLFILCARGEPRFQNWRTLAFDRMVAEPASTIAYLRTVLDTDDARERHTIKDILKDIGEPALPMLVAAVREDNDSAKGEASWILGIIGSAGGFDALMELSHASGWKLRSSAINAVGKLQGLPLESERALARRLRQVMDDPDEVFYVRKDAAFAAGNQGLCDLVPEIVAGLADDHYAVRYASAEAIRQLSGSCSGLPDALSERLVDMDARTVVACVYAAGDLAMAARLDLLERCLGLPQAQDPHVALALCRLAGAIEPENPLDTERLVRAVAAIPRSTWQVEALLPPKGSPKGSGLAF